MYLKSGAVLAHRYHVVGFLRLECDEIEVFTAVDGQTGRRVAVSAGCIGAKWVFASRPQQEALTQKALTRARAYDDRVLPLLDIAQDEEHGIVLVHELREGETLLHRVKQHGPMSLSALFPLIEQAWLGLCGLHATGTVHGTINPSSLLIETISEGDDRLTILPPRIDGLEASVGDERMFRESRPGDYSCQPPESFGKAKSSDARRDIYACSAVIFYGLSGRLPYDARNLLAMIDLMIKTDAPRLSAVIPGPIDPALDAFVARCLARDPGQRFKNAAVALAAWRQLCPTGELIGLST